MIAFYRVQSVEKLRLNVDILRKQKQYGHVIVIFCKADKFYNGKMEQVRKVASNFILTACFDFVKVKCSHEIKIKKNFVEYCKL